MNSQAYSYTRGGRVKKLSPKQSPRMILLMPPPLTTILLSFCMSYFTCHFSRAMEDSYSLFFAVNLASIAVLSLASADERETIFSALAGFFWHRKEVSWKAKLLRPTYYVQNIINDPSVAFSNSLACDPDAHDEKKLLI